VITVFFMPTYFSRSEIEFAFTTGWRRREIRRSRRAINKYCKEGP